MSNKRDLWLKGSMKNTEYLKDAMGVKKVDEIPKEKLKAAAIKSPPEIKRAARLAYNKKYGDIDKEIKEDLKDAQQKQQKQKKTSTQKQQAKQIQQKAKQMSKKQEQASKEGQSKKSSRGSKKLQKMLAQKQKK